MSETVDEILLQINEKSNQLFKIKRVLQEEIDFLKEKLYKICPHVWEIDTGYCGEHTEYICKKCYMSK